MPYPLRQALHLTLGSSSRSNRVRQTCGPREAVNFWLVGFWRFSQMSDMFLLGSLSQNKKTCTALVWFVFSVCERSTHQMFAIHSWQQLSVHVQDKPHNTVHFKHLQPLFCHNNRSQHSGRISTCEVTLDLTWNLCRRVALNSNFISSFFC